MTSKLSKFRVNPRTLQKELKQLIDTNRVSVKSQASLTEILGVNSTINVLKDFTIDIENQLLLIL